MASAFRSLPRDPAALTAGGKESLPGYMGIEILEYTPGTVKGRLPLRRELMAPNGYLHAGTLVTLADTLCGYGCILGLPEAAENFTTIELKVNFLSTLREGALLGTARLVHGGRTTQLWDAEIADEATGKVLAHFRCTQLIIYPAAR